MNYMYEKTSSAKFSKYGSVYDKTKDNYNEDLIVRKVIATDRVISNMYNFLETVYIEIIDGMACIVIGDSCDGDLKLFAIHGNIEIKPNMYFNIVPMGEKVIFKLIIPFNYNMTLRLLNPPYVYSRILPTINIPEIMAYYYTIKSPNYKFKGEKHNLYELTFVDNGSLNTVIEGIEYILDSYDLIIYGKNQFHNQLVNNKSSCSYLTVMFDMECEDDSLICNRVFHCRKELYRAIRTFTQNITSTLPHSQNLILCNFHEIIVRLFQYDYLDIEEAKLSTESRQYFEDEILQKIVQYIDERICKPITIEELCSKFAMSRSSLQTLFKNNLNTSPKKYINELKLAKSKLLIREKKYTISEIAFMLGFSSIHYFSRSFTQHYEISPSEYSQTVFKG